MGGKKDLTKKHISHYQFAQGRKASERSGEDCRCYEMCSEMGQKILWRWWCGDTGIQGEARAGTQDISSKTKCYWLNVKQMLIPQIKARELQEQNSQLLRDASIRMVNAASTMPFSFADAAHARYPSPPLCTKSLGLLLPRHIYNGLRNWQQVCTGKREWLTGYRIYI